MHLGFALTRAASALTAKTNLLKLILQRLFPISILLITPWLTEGPVTFPSSAYGRILCGSCQSYHILERNLYSWLFQSTTCLPCRPPMGEKLDNKNKKQDAGAACQQSIRHSHRWPRDKYCFVCRAPLAARKDPRQTLPGVAAKIAALKSHITRHGSSHVSQWSHPAQLQALRAGVNVS